MKFNKLFLGAAALFIFIFSSCKKDSHNHDNVSPATGVGNFVLEFDNVVGGRQLQLDSTQTTFTNGSGEKFSVTQFNYYVSNIQFRRTDGSFYTVPQDKSYFMIQENVAASQKVKIAEVPAGDYNQVRFILGVDSLRSTMDVGQRTGVLDPSYLSGHGMYWTWNSGYIFLKLEGLSQAAPSSQGNAFFYHIGGYGGFSTKTINNLKTITLDMPTTATLRTDMTPTAHILADVLKVFDGPGTQLKIGVDPTVMFSTKSLGIANNYAQMFMVHHVHNDHNH